MLNIKWKIVDQDFANFELSSTQLRLAAGDAGDNYLCGNCAVFARRKDSKRYKRPAGDRYGKMSKL